jgi:Trm5-related predicted tRNA methylase
MERAVVSVRPEKINEIKEALEKEISDNMSMEIAIVIYGPPEKLMSLSLKAMCKGAIAVSRN